MVVVNNCKKESSSKQYKTKIFDCLAYIRSAKGHFYAKPCNFKNSTPIKNYFSIFKHNLFIFCRFTIEFPYDL